MDAFDSPNNEIWQRRRDWIETELEDAQTGGSYLVSDHSIALFMDMQLAFCAGFQ